MSPKKVALWFLIISVAGSAALGIIAILTGNFGDFEIRIILTTLTISAASICALASGALWESSGASLLPLAGVVFALMAACLLVVGIWAEPGSDQFWRFTASVGVLAAATAHACLLALAKLSRRFAWARVAAFVFVFFLAACIIYIIYFEPKGDSGFRIIGVTAIVVAALTIMTPIFHRLSRGDLGFPHGTVSTTGQRLFPTCPQCGASQPNSPVEIRCSSCGCRFTVTVLE